MITRAELVFEQSNGEVTAAFYAELKSRGPMGELAVNLFRAQKNSSRAKVYRRRGSKGAAYDTKSWAMGNICQCLAANPQLEIVFGWKIDPETVFGDKPSWVLYIDLPNGQVSFHSPTRGEGPDYPGTFCGMHVSADRICKFCMAVLA